MNLRSTSPHYIKCVKPNADKAPGLFDAHMVLEQLRYSGALEVVRIRQEGFPISLKFVDLYASFEVLAFKRGWANSEECTTAQAKEYASIFCRENLLEKVDYQVGRTKVFLKSEGYERLHQAVGLFLGRKLRKLQALVRQRQATKRFVVGRRGIKKFQVHCNLLVLFLSSMLFI